MSTQFSYHIWELRLAEKYISKYGRILRKWLIFQIRKFKFLSVIEAH